MRSRSVFLLTWFYKIYETQKFKKFFDNFDTMYEYAELFIGRRIKELEEKSCKPSKETGLGQVHGCTWRTHFFLALWLPERKQYVRGVILVVPVAKNLQIHQTQSDLTKKTQRHFRPLHVAVNLTKNEHRI